MLQLGGGLRELELWTLLMVKTRITWPHLPAALSPFHPDPGPHFSHARLLSPCDPKMPGDRTQ